LLIADLTDGGSMKLFGSRPRPRELPRNGVCAKNARGYVHLNSPRHYVQTPVKTSTQGISVARTVPLVVSYDRAERVSI
jgi:hypothetical protein